MKYYEKTIDTETIYEGKIVNLKVDKVKLCNGSESIREIVLNQEGVAIVVNNNNKIIFVKQFRKPFEEEVLEIPAGKIEEDEEPLEAAIRELQEETGFIAENINKIGEIYPSPGFSNEIIHLFYTDKIKVGEINRDEDEFMDVEEIEINSVKEMIENCEIKDAKSICGILFVFNYLNI